MLVVLGPFIKELFWDFRDLGTFVIPLSRALPSGRGNAAIGGHLMAMGTFNGLMG